MTMKTIGLIGGMSWESTAEYYRIINEHVKKKLGGFHSARLLLFSVDFAEIEPLQRAGRWEETAVILADAARRLEKGGADFFLMCTNTMHKLADEVDKAVDIPLLHIADTTAEEILAAGMGRVGLLGTAYTMEMDFYKGRLAARHGLDIVIPAEPDIKIVHDVIYNELCLGQIKNGSRATFHRIIGDLVVQGAEGIVLGCTEIPLLVKPENSPVPLFNTTEIHARKAAELALGE